ncbi:MAG: Na+/H+ antiporter NhaC family protein, partial [Pseudomonadota bacterium]
MSQTRNRLALSPNLRLLTPIMIMVAAVLLPELALAQGADADETTHKGLFSILPPLLAIGIALIFRQVILALFIGLWVGAWAVYDLSLAGFGQGMLDVSQVYVVQALADEGHASVIVFSLLIGGMVGVIANNGGMQGVVARLTRWARDARRASLATAGLGLAIFFDDYANTLVVGNAMRPVTDRMGVSRAKLAYIVDSTAAPVTCVALITTWIGYQVGLIGDAAEKIGIETDAYLIFLYSLQYSFYPFLAIAFVFIIIMSRRDYGPMVSSEAAAEPVHEVAPTDRSDGQAGPPERAINAVAPIAVLILGVMWGLWETGGGGEGKTLQQVIGDGDSYAALVWASTASCIVAVALTVLQGIMTLEQTMEAWLKGVASMITAITILVMAWAMSGVTDALGTGQFLVEQLGDAINPGVLPTLVFLLAALTAFGTGTSFGTMGILIPLIVPLAWAVSGGAPLEATGAAVFYASIASVLGGAVWGDHVSPISDTTILSSMASGCDHVEHVNTQLPYAMTVATVAIAGGLLP